MKAMIKFRFVGTAYNGYQVQPGSIPTVQRALNEATRALFGYDCDVMGCSRTDAGVHARAFCAAVSKKGQFDLPTTIAAANIPRALCNYLPGDIAVTDACFVPDDFHPRYSVLAKEYVYRYFSSPIRDPFEEYRSWHIPCPLRPDAVERMNRAAQAFVGTHYFASYMAQGSKITDPTRTVKYATVEREGNILSFRVCADGFLYNMVRIMAGTLYEVAVGRREPESIAGTVLAQNRTAAGLTAPPHGLYLSRVFYCRPDVLPPHWD